MNPPFIFVEKRGRGARRRFETLPDAVAYARGMIRDQGNVPYTSGVWLGHDGGSVALIPQHDFHTLCADSGMPIFLKTL